MAQRKGRHPSVCQPVCATIDFIGFIGTICIIYRFYRYYRFYL